MAQQQTDFPGGRDIFQQLADATSLVSSAYAPLLASQARAGDLEAQLMSRALSDQAEMRLRENLAAEQRASSLELQRMHGQTQMDVEKARQAAEAERQQQAQESVAAFMGLELPKGASLAERAKAISTRVGDRIKPEIEALKANSAAMAAAAKKIPEELRAQWDPEAKQLAFADLSSGVVGSKSVGDEIKKFINNYDVSTYDDLEKKLSDMPKLKKYLPAVQGKYLAAFGMLQGQAAEKMRTQGLALSPQHAELARLAADAAATRGRINNYLEKFPLADLSGIDLGVIPGPPSVLQPKAELPRPPAGSARVPSSIDQSVADSIAAGAGGWNPFKIAANLAFPDRGEPAQVNPAAAASSSGGDLAALGLPPENAWARKFTEAAMMAPPQDNRDLVGGTLSSLGAGGLSLLSSIRSLMGPTIMGRSLSVPGMNDPVNTAAQQLIQRSQEQTSGLPAGTALPATIAAYLLPQLLPMGLRGVPAGGARYSGPTPPLLGSRVPAPPPRLQLGFPNAGVPRNFGPTPPSGPFAVFPPRSQGFLPIIPGGRSSPAVTLSPSVMQTPLSDAQILSELLRVPGPGPNSLPSMMNVPMGIPSGLATPPPAELFMPSFAPAPVPPPYMSW